MFLNFLGFSIIIPILPFLVGRYAPTSNGIALYVGLLLSVYALCQFLAAPGLGALSDHYGRRPILLISLLGSIVGYIVLGIGGGLGILFLGRIIDGLTGGNISTVYAYMADITEPKDRGKYYGMLGAAGGFGFMFGPAIGGFLANITLATPLFVAAGVTLLNLIWGYFVLPESVVVDPNKKLDLKHLNPFGHFSHIFSIRILRNLFVMSFFFFVAFNAMYGNASVYSKDMFGWGTTQIGIFLFVVGLIDIISQGFLVRKLLPILGDVKLAILGTVLSFVGFVVVTLTAFTFSPVLLYVGANIFNFGDGFFEPSLNSIISNSVGSHLQGRVQGASQSMQSVARIVGPLFAAWSYQYWRGLPYASEAVFILIAFVFLILSLPSIRSHVVAD